MSGANLERADQFYNDEASWFLPHEKIARALAGRGRFLDYILSLPVRKWHKRLPNGDTYLHLACMVKCTEAVKLLIDAGLDVNSQNPDPKYFNRLPIDCTIMENDPKTLAVLIQYGADDACKIITGNTIFEKAVMWHAYKCVNFLAPMVNMIPPDYSREFKGLVYRFSIGYSKTIIEVDVQAIIPTLGKYIVDVK